MCARKSADIDGIPITILPEPALHCSNSAIKSNERCLIIISLLLYEFLHSTRKHTRKGKSIVAYKVVIDFADLFLMLHYVKKIVYLRWWVEWSAYGFPICSYSLFVLLALLFQLPSFLTCLFQLLKARFRLLWSTGTTWRFNESSIVL